MIQVQSQNDLEICRLFGFFIIVHLLGSFYIPPFFIFILWVNHDLAAHSPAMIHLIHPATILEHLENTSFLISKPKDI